ncbi:MAG: hypothetical protein ACRDC6_31985, partial [Shewanella sp.]
MNWLSTTLLCTSIGLLSGCATSPPKSPENICDIFQEHRSWY